MYFINETFTTSTIGNLIQFTEHVYITYTEGKISESGINYAH